MHHTVRVGEGDRLRDAEEESQASAQRDWTGNVPVEPISLHPFHRVIGASVGQGANVMHGHHAGMLETR